jgi:hypothetical protein
MIHLKSMFAFVLLANAALAQSAMDGAGRSDKGAKAESGEQAAKRELRRAELRDALRSSQVQEPALLSAAAPAPTPRRLTPKELSELRQQLRRQQRDKAGSGN